MCVCERERARTSEQVADSPAAVSEIVTSGVRAEDLPPSAPPVELIVTNAPRDGSDPTRLMSETDQPVPSAASTPMDSYPSYQVKPREFLISWGICLFITSVYVYFYKTGSA